MAEIPVLRRSPIKTQPLPSARYTAGATGESFGGVAAQERGAMSRAVMALGEHIGDIVNSEEARLAHIEARDAINRYRSRVRELVDGPDGYRSRRGVDAIDIMTEAQETLESARQEIGRSLKRRSAADLYDTYSSQVLSSHMDSLALHEQRERDQADRDTLDAKSENSLQDALSKRGDPNEVAKFRLEALGNALARADIDGLPEEAAEVYARKAINTFDANMLDTYRGDKNYKAALDYLDAHERDFPPHYAAQVRRVLETENKEASAFELARDLEQRFPDYWERKQWILDNVQDPQLFEFVDGWVSKREAGRTAAKAAREEARSRTVWNELFDTVDNKQAGWQEWVPPADVSDSDRRSMELYLRQHINAWSDGKTNPESDQALKYKLKLYASEWPDAYGKLPLERYFPYLSRADRNELIDLQVKIRDRGTEDGAWKRAETSIGARVMDQWGIGRDPEGMKLRAQLDDLYKVWAYGGGEAPKTPEQVEALWQYIAKNYKSWNLGRTADVETKRSVLTGEYPSDALVPNVPPAKSSKPQPARHPRIPAGAEWNGDAGVWEVRRITGSSTRYHPDTGDEVK